MLKRLRCDRGVSLVETMASIFLFAIVITSILEIGLQNKTIGLRTQNSYTAYNLAKSHIETLKSLPYGTLSSAAETETRIDSTGVPDIEGAYKRTTAVTTNYTGDPNLTAVTVTVYYQIKGQFVTTPMTLSTVVFQYA